MTFVRLALWPAWLHVAEEGSDPLDDGALSFFRTRSRRVRMCFLFQSAGMLCTEETCKRQIEKDVPRPEHADSHLPRKDCCPSQISALRFAVP